MSNTEILSIDEVSLNDNLACRTPREVVNLILKLAKNRGFKLNKSSNGKICSVYKVGDYFTPWGEAEYSTYKIVSAETMVQLLLPKVVSNAEILNINRHCIVSPEGMKLITKLLEKRGIQFEFRAGDNIIYSTCIRFYSIACDYNPEDWKNWKKTSLEEMITLLVGE